MLLLMIPLVLGVELCMEEVQINTNCSMISPVLSCSNYTYEVLNASGNITDSGNLSIWNGNLYQFNFTEDPGEYVIRFCNSTTKEVEVVEGDGDMMIIAIIILIPILLGLLMMIGAASLGEDHNILKIGLFLFSIIPFFSSLHFGMISVIHFYEFTAMENLIGTTTYWIGMFFFILVSYFSIYVIYSIFQNIREKKRERMNY